MAKGTIMQKGSGGGKLFAAIGVTYPAGSTLTCTGQQTGKVLTAKPKVEGNTQWVFAIPEADRWTVTATDGKETAKQTVEITEEWQSVPVELSYSKYLFKSGEGAKVALSTSVEDSQCYATVGTDRISLGWQSNNRTTAFSTTEKINVSGYNTLEIEYTCSDAGSGNYYEAFGLSSVRVSTGTTTGNLTAARKAMTATSTKKIDTLDISNMSGEYYVGVCGAGKSETYNFRLVQ